MEEKIKTTLKNKPDTTTTELINELNLKISKSGLSKHLAKMNLSYKKSLSTLTGKNETMTSQLDKFGKQNNQH